MDPRMEALTAQVNETVGVEESAAALLGGLKQALTEAINAQSWESVTSLRDQLDTSEQALSAAVAANPI